MARQPGTEQRPRVEKRAQLETLEKPDKGDFVVLDDNFNLNLNDLAGTSQLLEADRTVQ
jgi:hypothetical protein